MTDAEKLLGDLPAEAVADHIISECGGDARAVVVELVAIVRHLAEEIRALSAASSPGYARRSPRRER